METVVVKIPSMLMQANAKNAQRLLLAVLAVIMRKPVKNVTITFIES